MKKAGGLVISKRFPRLVILSGFDTHPGHSPLELPVMPAIQVGEYPVFILQWVILQ